MRPALATTPLFRFSFSIPHHDSPQAHFPLSITLFSCLWVNVHINIFEAGSGGACVVLIMHDLRSIHPSANITSWVSFAYVFFHQALDHSYCALPDPGELICGLQSGQPGLKDRQRSQGRALTPRIYGNERNVPMIGACLSAWRMTGKKDLIIS